MSIFDRLDKFHHSKTGYAVFAVVELALAYLFVSWAVDSGSWFDYILALILMVGFLQNVAKLISKSLADYKRYQRMHRR